MTIERSTGMVEALTWEQVRSGRAYAAPDGTRWGWVASEQCWAGWSTTDGSTAMVVMEPVAFARKYPECPQPPWLASL